MTVYEIIRKPIRSKVNNRTFDYHELDLFWVMTLHHGRVRHAIRAELRLSLAPHDLTKPIGLLN